MTFRCLLLAAAGLLLAACGKQGDLVQPPPLFGESARAQYEADRARGNAPDETSAVENEREDAQAPGPSPNEETQPGNVGRPAAPVNNPPTPIPATPG